MVPSEIKLVLKGLSTIKVHTSGGLLVGKFKNRREKQVLTVALTLFADGNIHDVFGGFRPSLWLLALLLIKHF